MTSKKRLTKGAHSAMENVYIHVDTRKSSFKKRKKKLLTASIKPIDLLKSTSLINLVDSFKHMSIQARCIGQCADVYESMLTDKKRPTIFLGLAGPLIAGGLRKVIRDMIEYGIVDAVVSTGAILYQDLFQTFGYKLYKGSPQADDCLLRELLINRIYDTYFCNTWLAVDDFDYGGGKARAGMAFHGHHRPFYTLSLIR